MQPKTILMMWPLLWLLWIGLTGTFDVSEVLVGAVVALGVAVLIRCRPSNVEGGGFNQKALLRLPRSVLYMAAYLPYLFWAIIKANIDVARRVINPQLPIRPGIVKVRTRLRSRLGRLVLANSITLTPGTLTVDVDDDEMYIHWIDVGEGGNIDEDTRKIVADFERFLEVIFG